MAEAPAEAQQSDGKRKHDPREGGVFDIMESAIRRSTYLLLALGGLAGAAKLLREIAALFGN